MSRHSETIDRLYRAFGALDARAMAACYAPDAHFADPVFALEGREEIAAMWSMLCEAVREGGGEWSLAHVVVQGGDSAAGGAAGAHWEARYRFSGTGRPVCNRIDALMRFDADGLIVDHIDRFDFWRWSRQALGLPGLLLGWTPLLRARVRAQAAARLQRHRTRVG